MTNKTKKGKKGFQCGNCNKRHYTDSYSCTYEPPISGFYTPDWHGYLINGELKVV